jgi:hypothetical protein
MFNKFCRFLSNGYYSFRQASFDIIPLVDNTILIALSTVREETPKINAEVNSSKLKSMIAGLKKV